MKILFISRWFPHPPDNGSKIRVFNLIKWLSSCHEVDLISFASEGVGDERSDDMRRYCRHVDLAPYRPFQPGRLKALLGFMSQWPRSVVDTHSVEMQRLIEQAQRVRAFDVAIASQIDTAPYVTALPGMPKILEEMELTTLYERLSKERHPVKKLRKWSTWWKLSRYVTDLLRASDGCTVVSERERERILQVSPGYRSIAIVPNGVDVAHYASDFGAPETDTLVYPGALTYSANFDAMDFFLREVFPLVRAERPNVRVSITGRLDGVPVDRLPGGDGVILTGYLDDVRPAVARSWACVVPLRIGGGTRLKILEALALGTPVVATSKGAEGLDLEPGRDLLVADEPADFAAAVLRLLQDPALREMLSRNGRRAVEAKYDWRTIGRQFNDFVETVVAQAEQACTG
jgi:glycosyltransferase involved in cell wall biosynthesis